MAVRETTKNAKIAKVRLGDVAVVSAGQGAPQGDSAYSTSGGIPFVRAGHLVDLVSGLPESQLPGISEEVAKKYRLKLQHRGTVLFAKSGMSCMKGLVYRLKTDCYVVSHLATVKTDSDITDHYLEFYFQEHKPNLLIKDPAYPSLSLSDISQIRLALPPLPEQKRIAEELDRICELKKNAEERLALMDQLVKSRFVEMFGDPLSNTNGFPVMCLSKLILHANNGMTRRGKDECGQIVLRIVELRDGYIDYSCPNRIKLTDKERERYLLVENDFLFVRVNGNPEYVGRCAYFKDIGEPVFHNDHIIRVRFSDDVNSVYMSTILNGMYGKQEIRDKLKTSAGQYTINQDGIGSIKIPLPPLALQREFAAFVAEVDKSKSILRETVTQMETLYKAKLQEYFG